MVSLSEKRGFLSDRLAQQWVRATGRNVVLQLNAITLWAVFFCGTLYSAAGSFTIRSTGGVRRIEVRYFLLTGPFSGYGGFVRQADKGGAYRIPLEQDGNPAKRLKAILYAQGCQFELVSADLTAEPTRSATYECRQLPTTTLKGRISPPPSGAGRLDVEVRYFPGWDHKFFGISKGMIEQFSVGKGPLLSGGRFRVDIPNFSKDAITQKMQDGFLQVLVIEHSTGVIVASLMPPPGLRYGRSDLKILPSYTPEVTFESRPW